MISGPHSFVHVDTVYQHYLTAEFIKYAAFGCFIPPSITFHPLPLHACVVQ